VVPPVFAEDLFLPQASLWR